MKMQCINVLSGYQHKMCMRQINLVFRVESVPFLRPFIVYKQKIFQFQTFVLKTFQISHSQQGKIPFDQWIPSAAHTFPVLC